MTVARPANRASIRRRLAVDGATTLSSGIFRVISTSNIVVHRRCNQGHRGDARVIVVQHLDNGGSERPIPGDRQKMRPARGFGSKDCCFGSMVRAIGKLCRCSGSSRWLLDHQWINALEP
jgi:hypothetical protein